MNNEQFLVALAMIVRRANDIAHIIEHREQYPCNGEQIELLLVEAMTILDAAHARAAYPEKFTTPVESKIPVSTLS
jgi:hypothetical protein